MSLHQLFYLSQEYQSLIRQQKLVKSGMNTLSSIILEPLTISIWLLIMEFLNLRMLYRKIHFGSLNKFQERLLEEMSQHNLQEVIGLVIMLHTGQKFITYQVILHWTNKLIKHTAANTR